MGFVKLNQRLKEQRKIVLDTAFVFEYMPLAPELYTKVYLTGLAFANSDDNEIDEIALKLDIDHSVVIAAFSYWQKRKLVTISWEPLFVEYLQVVPIKEQTFLVPEGKYKPFNDQLHALYARHGIEKDRPVLTNEYNKYYDFMESTGMEIETMLIIISHCINQKSGKAVITYILKTARDLIEKGFCTYDKVQKQLSSTESYNKANYDLAKKIVKALGQKYDSYEAIIDDYISPWIKLGFNENVLLLIAKKCALNPSIYYRTLDNMNKSFVMPCHDKRAFDEVAVKEFLTSNANDNKISKSQTKKHYTKTDTIAIKDGNKNVVKREASSEELNAKLKRLSKDEL